MQKNKKQKIIALACEAEVLAAIVAIASPFYEVIKTRDPKRALMGIAEHAPVAAVIADHRLSGASGLTFLAAVQKRWPAVQRILLAEPEDMQQIIHGLHSGAVQHVLHKPMQRDELLQIIRPPAARPTVPPAIAAQPQPARRAAG